MNPWLFSNELDLEQLALLEHEGRGLGMRGPWEDVENWYGGRIQQTAQVELPDKDDPHSSLRIRLRKMEMTRSHKFARHVGSRRILQLRLPARAELQCRELLSKKFVLCGRVFRPLKVKDRTSYLLEVNEDHDRSHLEPGDQWRPSYDEFVHWHNPIEHNQNQVLFISVMHANPYVSPSP